MAQAQMLQKALKRVAAGAGAVEAHHIPEPKKSKLEKQMMSPGPHQPMMWLDSKQFPGVENWNAGDKVTLAVTCHVERMSKTEGDNKQPSAEASLKIVEIADLSMHGGVKMLPPGMSATTCPDCKKMVKLNDSRIKPGHKVGNCPECGRMFASPAKGAK